MRNTQYFHISSSEIDISLPYISAGGSLMPMQLPSDFDIFCTPSSAFEHRRHQHDLRLLTVVALQLPAASAG